MKTAVDLRSVIVTSGVVTSAIVTSATVTSDIFTSALVNNLDKVNFPLRTEFFYIKTSDIVKVNFNHLLRYGQLLVAFSHIFLAIFLAIFWSFFWSFFWTFLNFFGRGT